MLFVFVICWENNRNVNVCLETFCYKLRILWKQNIHLAPKENKDISYAVIILFGTRTIQNKKKTKQRVYCGIVY